MTGPLDRLTASLPAPWDTIVDWAITITIAVAAVLAIKAWVVNPYRIPSSSMEPTLHCATPEPGCQADASDRVLANRFIYRFRDPKRGDIVVFETPQRAIERCGAGGTFVKRLIGTPGDTISMRGGVLQVNGQRVDEPYVNGGPPGSGLHEADARGRRVLHDGRQPCPVLRQPRVGNRLARRSDRPGIRRLLATDSARPAVTGGRFPPR